MSAAQDTRGLAQRLISKLDVKIENHLSDMKDLEETTIKSQTLSFHADIQSLEASIYRRNNLEEFQQQHVLYASPADILLMFLQLGSSLVEFLTKFKFGISSWNLPTDYEIERILHQVNSCLLYSVNLNKKYG